MAGCVFILILVGKIMAKNIKQMAEEYAYTNWQSDDYHDGAAEGLPFDAIGHTERTYMAGANYVLKEIEDYLENYTLPKDSLLKFYILSIFSDIHDKIKQLKGE